MHFLMLVTLDMALGSTSEDARLTVHDALRRDDSFCGTGGRFGSPLCDWFVIGGRWSGRLAETRIGKRFRSALRERFPELNTDDLPALARQRQAEVDAVWESCGGIAPGPYARTGDEELGHPDDAALLTRELYDAWLAAYEGESRVDVDVQCAFVDLNDDALSPDCIGRKWLVLVDYHC